MGVDGYGKAIGGVVDGFCALASFVAVMLLVLVPLSLVGVISIAVWLWNHVSVSVH